VVVLHGAGSCKESHHDYARSLLAAGLAAILFDQRGHGASAGPMDGRVLSDVLLMASLLRSECGAAGLPIALRGSSMGGCLALLAAPVVEARAVVAICPAPPSGLRRGLDSGALGFDADAEALDRFLAGCNLDQTVDELSIPVLVMHAAGDEAVPVELSRELSQHFRNPASRLIVVPAGHHRSVQHDLELQAVSVSFILKALTRSRESHAIP
jgi:alpha-beta hydrolase superfamily lysophospholipase